MSFQTLISVAELQALLAGAAPPVLLDCSFELSDPAKGERTHAAGHLPGALYVHLDRDLSGPRHPDGPRSPGFTGRHPLPTRAALALLAGRLGIAPGVQVVAFDGEGSPYAARAWWLLRWLGHADVAVLDGGIGAWLAAGLPLTRDAGVPRQAPPYPERPPAMAVIDAATLLAGLDGHRIVDARGAARFSGQTEPLDPVAGHIPGAVNRFFNDNLQADGRFKPAAQLRAEFERVVAGGAPVVHQCGSGVTACHNLLAMEHAGLPGSALYAGSWSEWCADPARPVARG